MSIDPDGPAARAGLLVGDIVTAWNAKPAHRVREVMRLLGPDSAGSTVDLGLIRGGAPTALKVAIGELTRGLGVLQNKKRMPDRRSIHGRHRDFFRRPGPAPSP